jgi:hypothetical protein
MTDNLLSQADVADREADGIFAKIEAARGRDGALIPAGFTAEAERASDLRRRANALRAQVSALRPKPATIAPPPVGAPEFRAEAAAKARAAIAPVETADSVAARILASDSTAPDRAPAPQGHVTGAVDPIEAVARRILEA